MGFARFPKHSTSGISGEIHDTLELVDFFTSVLQSPLLLEIATNLSRQHDQTKDPWESHQSVHRIRSAGKGHDLSRARGLATGAYEKESGGFPSSIDALNAATEDVPSSYNDYLWPIRSSLCLPNGSCQSGLLVTSARWYPEQMKSSRFYAGERS